ncbi:MAG: sugar ABC transporter ATP-binding protein [Clostridia bacterium]
MTADNLIFKAEKIDKYFGPTHANSHIDFELKKGEIRGLIGENGSGKSTFISVISGIQQKDSGCMYINGRPYEPKSSLDAIKNKIGTVVQELGLVEGLTAGLNIFLGRTSMFSKNGILNMKALYAEAKKVMTKWELDPSIELSTLAGTLSVEDRKVIELARALSNDPDILILDEITNALSLKNRTNLFRIINKMKSEGKSVIIISHDLEEVIDVTDNITVMRDGSVSGNVCAGEIQIDMLKRMMVGREMQGSYYRDDDSAAYQDEVVFKVEKLEKKHLLHDICFELHKGEILGICGLADSGTHDLGKALFGLIKPDSGKCLKTDKNTLIDDPITAMKHKIAYVPKDRDREALMTSATIRSNMSLPSVRNIEAFFGFLSPRKMKALAEKAVKNYEVKTTGIEQIVSGLSGGNRQKVNLARWMAKDADIYILDCPTRGVDIGVKAYIYDSMKTLASQGKSIIMVSDELPEAIGMADRIIVLKCGKIEKIFTRGSAFTEESIIEVMI